MTANPTARRFPAKLVKRLAAFLVALLWLWSAGFVAATAQEDDRNNEPLPSVHN